LFFLSSSR